MPIAPKDLKKLIKLCREMGVTKYQGAGFSFELADTVLTKSIKTTPITTNPVNEAIETEELTDEEKLFWSSNDGGQPISEGN